MTDVVWETALAVRVMPFGAHKSFGLFEEIAADAALYFSIVHSSCTASLQPGFNLLMLEAGNDAWTRCTGAFTKVPQKPSLTVFRSRCAARSAYTTLDNNLVVPANSGESVLKCTLFRMHATVSGQCAKVYTHAHA